MAGENLFTSLPDGFKPKVKAVNENVPEQFRGKNVDDAWDSIQKTAQDEWKAREDELRREFDEKLKATKPAEQPPQQQQQFVAPPPQQQQMQQQEEPNILLEPDKYMDAQFQRRMGPLVQQQAATMRYQNSQLFQNKYPDLYKEYGTEIENFIGQLSPQLQADPRSYDIARTVTLGQHADEIVEKRTKAQLAKFMQEHGIQDTETPPAQQPPQSRGFFGGSVRPPVSEVSNPTGQSSKSGIQLTQAQKEMAKRFDMTEDEYKEYLGYNTDQLSALREGAL
jgi:hypothetical protein